MHSAWRPLAALACSTVFFVPIAGAAPGDELKALLDQGRPAAAYAEGKKNPDLLGDPNFDFHFGIAAIDSGHAAEGVLALERYLLSFPDNLSARLHLARGFFVLGDDAHARAEFEAVRKVAPSAQVAATIDQFLDAIRLRETRYTMSSGAYVEVGGGHDSNVNAGPAAASIFLPGFGLQPLEPGSQKLADSFTSLGAGGYLSYPVRPGVTLFANAQGERRWHHDNLARAFELGNYNASGGVSILGAGNIYRLIAHYGHLTVGPASFRRAAGVSAEWQRQLGEAQSVTLGAHAARLDHFGANQPRDADFFAITAVYRRQFQHAWQPVAALGLSAGEQRTRTDHPELVPRSLGASASVTFTPAAKWGVLLGYTFQASKYQAADFFAFPESRRDRYHAFNAAVSYLLTRSVSLRAEALVSRNRSNADAYEFPREVFALKVRYEFK